ncbi:hypothetical protein [Robertmurraya siralis]|uniref:hypothetical protein n=1 Tax=Robertmurraya siralis TaxID=77777 RepID=UPI0010F60BB5|nr:hypothetical protein [Robertmurraya siralis]
MLNMGNIPEHIRTSLKNFYKQNEKPDVFPSKFQVNGEYYYYFTFAPAKEQLIMKEDGTVPYFHEIKREALIFNNYNISIESLIAVGGKWVKSDKRKNYEQLLNILKDLKKKLPTDLNSSYNSYVMTAERILEEQSNIEMTVQKATEIWDRTNHEELATEQDQIDMRQCIVDLSRAAYRQNEIQLRTEKEREIIWNYVSSNKWSIGLGLYLNLKKYQKNMMKNTPENIREAEETGKMVLGEDLPLEKHENAEQVWKQLRNPR